MRLRSLIFFTLLALAVAPSGAGAFATTGSFTASDYHWGETGTGASTVHIDPGGTVSFGYPSGFSTHDADFGATQPTSCAPSLPTVPTAPGWSSDCQFSTTGTYTFFCDLHATMRATVLVGDVPDPPPASGGGGSNNPPPAGDTALGGIKLAKVQHSTRVTGSVAAVPAGSDLTVTITRAGKRVGRTTRRGLAAGTASFSVKLSSAAKRQLKKSGRLGLKAGFKLVTPTGTLTASRSVTLKQP